MTQLHVRHPWIVSILLALAFLGVALAFTPIGNQVERLAGLPLNSGVLIQQAALLVVSLLAVMAFGGWRAAGFGQPVQWQTLLMLLPPFAAPVILLIYYGLAPTDLTQMIMLIIFTAMIGVTEEALCRGVMLQGFLPQGPMRAAVLSSLIFGGMHLIQLFYGMNLATALLYVIFAALIGFGFAAPYIRSGGALWPVIIAHSVFDFMGKISHGWGAAAQPTSSFEIVVRLGVALLVAVYGFWLLRSFQPTGAGTREPRPRPGPAVDIRHLPGAPKAS